MEIKQIDSNDSLPTEYKAVKAHIRVAETKIPQNKQTKDTEKRILST